MDLQASLGCGCGDELDDDLVADQGASLPVLADEGEEPVLDLVPLAGAGREMADGDVEPDLVGQLLELPLPQTHARPIAAAAIGGNLKPLGPRIAGAAELAPPAANGVDGEGGGVVIGADVDPSGVARQIIDAVGDRAAQLLDQEVVRANLLRRAVRPIGATRVLEVADQLLLLGGG